MTLVQTEPKKIYIGNTEIKSVYLGDTKIRPIIKEAYIEWLLVGGGGAGGRSVCNRTGGGGGAGLTGSNSRCCTGGDGCQGVFIARYSASCNYNITGGTKYLCNGYCIHCFTSNGTLTIN